MANDLNRVCLIGRLGKDAELHDTKTGKQYMKFGLATNRRKGREEVTEWHNVIVWNEKLVENLHPYLKKGKQVYLEGLVTSFESKDRDTGEARTVPLVEVSFGHNIQLLGSKDDTSSVNSTPASVVDDDPTAPPF